MSDAQEVTIDDVELEAQGYEREMPRQFSLVSLMALSYALLATWNGFGRFVDGEAVKLTCEDNGC